LAAEAGGNCELTEPDTVVVKHGVTIHGPTNLPATMPGHASQLYARNVTQLLREFVKDGTLALGFDHEVIRRARVTPRRGVRQRRGEAGSAGEEDGTTTDLEVGLYIFMLAGFLGYPIIPPVPPLLHTPLMSATNAIAAISLVGSLVVAGGDYSNVPNGWVCTL